MEKWWTKTGRVIIVHLRLAGEHHTNVHILCSTVCKTRFCLIDLSSYYRKKYDYYVI